MHNKCVIQSLLFRRCLNVKKMFQAFRIFNLSKGCIGSILEHCTMKRRRSKMHTGQLNNTCYLVEGSCTQNHKKGCFNLHQTHIYQAFPKTKTRVLVPLQALNTCCSDMWLGEKRAYCANLGTKKCKIRCNHKNEIFWYMQKLCK